MKKTIISALALMLGVFGFSGCVKNADETIINSEIQEFTLISYADAPNTRMNISGDKTTGFSTNWEDGDQIGVYAVSENAEHSLYTCNYYHRATVDSDGLAKFTGTIRSTGGDDFNLYAYYPYTAGSTYKDPDDQNGVDCKISSEQTMSGASFDKSCAYMVAKTGLTVNTSSQNDTYKVGNWQFRHTVAFINLSTKEEISADGVSGDEIVSSVKFDAAGKTLAGDFQFNLEDGTMTFTKSESAVTVKVPDNTKLSDLSAWIVTNPFELTANDKLVITITTDAHTIIKNVSIAKNFEAANVYTLNLTIDNKCEISKDAVYELVTDASTLAEGDQVIIVSTYKKLSAYYAMGNTQNNNNRSAETVTIVNGNDNTYTITNPSSDVQIFTLQYGSKQGTFAFYTGNGYIYAAGGGNYLRTDTDISDNSSWLISSSADTNSDFGTVASIVAQGKNTPKNILYNSSTTPTVFSCYNEVNTTIKAVTIFRLQDDREPLVKPAITVTPDNTNKSITVSWKTVDNATSYVVSCTGQTEQTFNAAGEYTFTGLEYGKKYTVTVTASADGYRSSSASEEGIEIIDYNLAKPVLASVTGTTEKITATWAAVQHAKSYIYKLNKLKDNVETTVIDETPYEPTDLKAETVTLTIKGSFTAGEQYVLYVKSTADAPFVESAPAKSEVFTITTEQQVSSPIYIATFDNDGEHRANTQNSYTSTPNSYTVNGATWSLKYADCVTTGTPLSGSANIFARVAKNTTNSPTATTSNILASTTGKKTITKLSFFSKLNNSVNLTVYYSIDNETNWIKLEYIKDADIHETYGYSANIENIQTDNLELKFEWSVSSSNKSARDSQLDEVKIYGY